MFGDKRLEEETNKAFKKDKKILKGESKPLTAYQTECLKLFRTRKVV